MSDNYEFSRSQIQQGIGLSTPYVDKNSQYVVDINNGVYSNSGLTQVNFDMGSIFNSNKMVDMSQAYICIPICVAGAYSNFNTNALMTPSDISDAGNTNIELGLKSGYWNLIHQAELTLDGKQIEQTQSFLNQYVQMKLMSQMSLDDMNSFGQSLGIGVVNESPSTIQYNNKASSVSNAVGAPNGNGIINNNFFDNQSFNSRQSMVTNMTTDNALYTDNLVAGGVLNSRNEMNAEDRSYFTMGNANTMVRYYTAVIRLKDIFDSMNVMPLTRRFSGFLRLWVNTGTLSVVGGNIEGTQCMTFSATDTNFTGTCPLLIGQPKTETKDNVNFNLVAGVFIVKPPQNVVKGVNLGLISSHSIPSCRLYYPQITVKEEKLESYLNNNRTKTLNWTNIYSNTYQNISAGSSFNQLVLTGISKIKGVWIVPYLSAKINGLLNEGAPANNVPNIMSFSQYASPMDSCPATNAPLSLTNLNVAIGGQNVFQNNQFYTFSNFMENICLYDKINASDFGLSCGLISQQDWEQGCRWYYVDCSRGNIADDLTPRSLVVSFNVNCRSDIDLIIFTEYSTECTIDVMTSAINM